MVSRSALVAFLIFAVHPTCVWPQSLLPGFHRATPFDESVKWSRLESGVRVFVNAPVVLTARPRVLVVFATPNGNTIEQSLGCAATKELDWRFDIQHVAAQMRRLREIDAEHEFVLAVVQAPQLSWPTFRRTAGWPHIAELMLGTSTTGARVPATTSDSRSEQLPCARRERALALAGSTTTRSAASAR